MAALAAASAVTARDDPAYGRTPGLRPPLPAWAPLAIALSKATMRNIKQNLVLAFGYNTAAIPVAAGLLYPFTGVLLSPLIAAAAMALSSTGVVVNSTRLNAFTAPESQVREQYEHDQAEPAANGVQTGGAR